MLLKIDFSPGIGDNFEILITKSNTKLRLENDLRRKMQFSTAYHFSTAEERTSLWADSAPPPPPACLGLKLNIPMIAFDRVVYREIQVIALMRMTSSEVCAPKLRMITRDSC